MGINRISKFLIIYLFTLFIISCKQSVRKDGVINADAIKKVETKQKISQDKEQLSQKNEINFVKNFYKTYLTEINKGTLQSNFNKYLSKDLIKYINSIDDGNPIINAQDYKKFDLNTLKVLKTQKNNVFKVEFINMGNQTIMFAKVKSINGNYKITNLTEDFNNANKDVVLPNFISNEYYFNSLSYYIEPSGDPRTAIVFYIEEDFEGEGTVLKKQAYNNYFEYLCSKKVTKKGIEFYYKKNIGLEEFEYTGDKNKPLITIYKKGNVFYAKSPIIEDGKEIKLEEE